MKVLAIGAGGWGKNIVRTLHEIGALAAVVDLSPAVREQVASQYPDVPLFDSLEQALSTDVDGVTVATPAPTHHAVAKQALSAGKHVFVEKPMTIALADGVDLVESAERAGRVLMVGHLLMYQPAVRWIKEQLAAGTLGELRSIHQNRLNLGKARPGENVLWSLGVHDLAVILDLIGSVPTSIWAVGHRMLQPNIEDETFVHMEFANGVTAHLHNSWLWPDKDRRMTVIGSTGFYVFDEATNAVTLHRKSIDGQLNNVDAGSEVAFQGASQPLTVELNHFIDCIKTGQEPISSGRKALAVVETIERANADMTRGGN